MIYKNGTPWDGWKASLGKNFKLSANPEFILSDNYRHFKEVSPGKTVPMYSPLMMITPTYEMVDNEGQTVEIRYVEREANNATRGTGAKQQVFSKYTPEIIEFVDGYMRFKKEKLDLFWFMLNHPDNSMNPLYSDDTKRSLHAKPFIFYYKDKAREEEIAYSKEKLAAEAIVMAASGMTKDESRQIYMILNPSADKNASQRSVDLFLMTFARNNPAQFLAATKSDDRKFEATVKEAVAFKIIKYQPQVRFWRFTDVDGESFCPVPRSMNEVKALVLWLRKDDTDGSTLKLLEDALKAARKKAEEEQE